jgi:hypothetical protein
MKKTLLILILMVVASAAMAELRRYHDDGCYVASDKCKLFEVMNVRAWWRVLIPDLVHEGWLFKLRNGSLVNVVEFGNIICGICGTNGKMFYIATNSLHGSPDWGFDVAPPPLPSSEVEAKWAKAEGDWAD